RRDCGGQRRGIPASRLYRPSAGDAGHVGRVDRVAIGCACVDGRKHSCAPPRVRARRGPDGARNDRKRTAGEDLTDERMDRWIGGLLRGGVVLAAVVALAGGFWHVSQAGTGAPELRVFRGEPGELRSVAGVLRGVGAGHSASLIQLGLLLLIAT